MGFDGTIQYQSIYAVLGCIKLSQSFYKVECENINKTKGKYLA